MNLILIGYRGVGKSCGGKLAAINLKVNFIDCDLEIENKFNLNVNEIFNNFGENKFRDAEEELLSELSEIKNTIIATGGGIVIHDQNRLLLKKLGKIIWLRANENTIFNRIKNEVRPRLTNLSLMEEITQITLERENIYKSISDFSIDTNNKTIMEVALVVQQFWG